MAVKSEPRETRLKSRSKFLAGVGNEVTDSAAQQGARRGRPRSADKGQVVSCRLPADELHAFDALCTQLGAKSRSDGVRSVVRMASGFLEFSREDSAKLEEIRYELGKIGTNVNQIALAATRQRPKTSRSSPSRVHCARRRSPSSWASTRCAASCSCCSTRRASSSARPTTSCCRARRGSARRPSR